MTRRPAVPVLGALAVLVALASACATTVTVVPGPTLALIDVSYAEGRFEGDAVARAEESPSTRVARSLLRQLRRDERFTVTDARHLGVRPADLASDPRKVEALRRQAPADAWLAVRLLACGAWPMRGTEPRGATAASGTIPVYWFSAECTVEVVVFTADGRPLATLQETGRWESPRREQPQGRLGQAQALDAAVDDAARLLADRLRPRAGGSRTVPAPRPRNLHQTLAVPPAPVPSASEMSASCSVANAWCEPGAGAAEARRPA